MLAAAGAFLMATMAPGRAQTTTDPLLANAQALVLQNQYIRLAYGISGTPAVAVRAAPDTSFTGRWGIDTTGGDPSTALDDNRIAFAWNFLSYQIEPQLEAQSDRWYRIGNTQLGSYTIGPDRDLALGRITSRWSSGGTIAVTVSSGSGSQTVQQPPYVDVEETLTLVRDMVRAEYRFINTGSLARRVRVRFYMDPAEGGVWTVGRQQLEVETDFRGGQVPVDWRMYCPVATPELVLRGIFNRFGATLPNRVVVGDAARLASGPWNYTVNPSIRLSGEPDPQEDAAQAYYETFDLMPYQSKTFVMYVGLGVTDGDPTPPYVLAVQSPRCLGFTLGDDPDTPERETSYVSPRSFTVQAFMYNVAEFDIQNASVFITLPAGLRLAAGESPVQQIGTILRQREGVASWRVEVEPGVSGVLSYTVTSSGMPVSAKTATGSIEIPAQATRAFKAGLSMMSVPFQFANPDVAMALNMSPDRIRLARWDSKARKYAFYPDSSVSTIEPGMGFWFKPDLDMTLALKDASPVPRSMSANFILPIKQGWNMIGAPYVYAVPWANTRVSDGQTVISLEEAARAGWLRPTLFRYNPNLSPPGYEFDSLLDAMLEPWQGYWVRSDRDLFLLIPKVTAPYASIVAPDQRSGQPAGWRIQLAARTRSASDLFNFAGASPSATDGYDLGDVDEPPVPSEGFVSLSFVHNDWGRHNGEYTQDLRSSDFGLEKSWDVAVRTQGDEEVTLTWPDLNARLPRGLTATLEDTTTGRRIFMRTQAAYTFRSQAGSVRRLKLVVSRRANAPLAITNVRMQAVPGRAGARAISFDASSDSVVDVRILSPTGGVVSEVTSRAPACAGHNSVVWDGTNRSGALLTSGLVLVEVSARTPDGTAVRVVSPCVLVR